MKNKVAERAKKKRRALKDVYKRQAWSMVRKAICNGIYGYKEEYRKLPDKVKTAIGNPLMIHEWAKVSADELLSLIHI